MATLKDIASIVGVSVATVSYVLTGRGSVSDEVKEKVLAVAKDIGYKPNRKAQAMRTGMSKCIGLVIPDLTNPFYPELAQKIESAARAAGFSVIMMDCENDSSNEEEGLNLLEQQGIDGIIWCPTGSKSLARLAQLDCPTVLIDRAHPDFDAVHCDYVRGGALLAEYAIRCGHRKVGLLNGPQDIESARQRRLGFINAAGDDLEICWEVEGPFLPQLPEAAQAALQRADVSMVVAANDLIAIGAIDVLQQAGIAVPEQVSVVGFDNIPWSALITPKLTTINHAVANIANEAMDILVQKISAPEKPVRTVVLGVELVERQSVKIMETATSEVS